MTETRMSILLPWHGGELGSTFIRRVKDTESFARWIGACLNVLVAHHPDTSAVMRIQRRILSRLPADHQLVFDTSVHDMVTATLSALERKKSGLVLLVAEPGKLEFSEWQRELIERVVTPIVLVPCRARLGPPEAILVPLQGDHPVADSGLDYSLQLAARYRLPLDIVHVTPKGGEDQSMVGQLGDTFYHDYPSRVNEMVAQASPMSSPRERSMIRKFLHVEGDTKREILRQLARYRKGMVALQWKGIYAPGHAAVVKSIARASPCPVLLTRREGYQSSVLQLGNTVLSA